MSTRLAARKDQKRFRIMEAAKRRFGRFGIRATTMQEIAHDADIAVGTIYQFFPDKDSLILEWVEEHRQLLHTQLESVLRTAQPADEKLRTFLSVRFHTMRTVREEPAIAELSRAVLRLAPDTIAELTQAVTAYLRAILEEGLRTKCLPSVDPAEDAEILMFALAGFFPGTVDPLHEKPTEQNLMRLINWFIAKWKLPRRKTQS